MILEAAVIPPHISIKRSAAKSEQATHNNTPTAPSRHPLPVRRQTATTAAAAQRGTITATSASPGLIGNNDGIDSRSSRNPPHISIQRSAARSKEATTHNTPTELTRHPLAVRDKRPQQQQERRGTITATSASPELIGITDGKGMNMLLELPTQQLLIPLDDQSMQYKR